MQELQWKPIVTKVASLQVQCTDLCNETTTPRNMDDDRTSMANGGCWWAEEKFADWWIWWSWIEIRSKSFSNRDRFQGRLCVGRPADSFPLKNTRAGPKVRRAQTQKDPKSLFFFIFPRKATPHHLISIIGQISTRLPLRSQWLWTPLPRWLKL